jgi:dephospho-CoA kinase
MTITVAKRKLCVGLTGGIGSGKSTVAELFRQRGAHIIDTDAIAHQLSQANGIAMPDILQQFGKCYLEADGALNRRAMRELIFNSPAAKKKLEAILHPLILQQTHTQLEQAGTAPYTLLIVPLLLQSPDFQAQVQRILVIDCSEAAQIQRVQQRSQLNTAAIKSIIAQQSSRSERLARANDIIYNEGNISELAAQVAVLNEIYTQNN